MSRFFAPEQMEPGSAEWACTRSAFDDLMDFARARIAEDPHMTEAEERASYDRFWGEGAWDRMAEKAVAERAARNALARAAVEAACAHWFAPKQEPSA